VQQCGCEQFCRVIHQRWLGESTRSIADNGLTNQPTRVIDCQRRAPTAPGRDLVGILVIRERRGRRLVALASSARRECPPRVRVCEGSGKSACSVGNLLSSTHSTRPAASFCRIRCNGSLWVNSISSPWPAVDAGAAARRAFRQLAPQERRPPERRMEGKELGRHGRHRVFRQTSSIGLFAAAIRRARIQLVECAVHMNAHMDAISTVRCVDISDSDRAAALGIGLGRLLSMEHGIRNGRGPNPLSDIAQPHPFAAHPFSTNPPDAGPHR
jgi:hypothetical protein